MRITELMSQPAETIGADQNLEAVARQLWEHDRGALVVVDANGVVAGMSSRARPRSPTVWWRRDWRTTSSIGCR